MGWEDDRGVSEVLGAILLFGIIVMAIGGYQAFVVPQQTAEIELNHNDRVSEDMKEFRNALLSAAADNEPRSSSIELAPKYPTRTIGLNPGASGGTLSTEAAGPIEIDADFSSGQVCDEGLGPDTDVSTRSITYTPNYHAYRSGQSITVDSSIVYRQSGDESLVDTSQILIRGSRIQLMPIQGDFSETGEHATSVTMIPSGSGGKVVGDDASDNFNVSIPTTLSAEAWEEELESSSDYFVTVHSVPGEERVKIELMGTGTSGGPSSYTFRCTAIGLDTDPGLNPPGIPFTDDLNETTEDGLNPHGAFVLERATLTGDNATEVTFRHRGSEEGVGTTSDLTITEARFAYYGPLGQGAGGGQGQPFQKPETAAYRNVSDFEIGGSARSVDGHTWESGETKSITISFDEDAQAGDFYILRLKLEGEGVDPILADYFVGVDSE